MKHVKRYQLGDPFPPGSAVLFNKYIVDWAGTFLAVFTIVGGFSFYTLAFYLLAYY